MSTAPVVVVTEQRCWPGPDGHVLGRMALSALHGLPEHVPCVVAARRADPEPGGRPLLPGAAAGALLDWPGTLRDLAGGWRAWRGLWRLVGTAGAVLVYVPGLLGSLAAVVARLRGRPVAVVAVGDPRTSLARDVLPGPIGTLARVLVTAATRAACRRAAVVRYVTGSTLQRLYPPGGRAEVFGFTDTVPAPAGTARRLPSTARTLRVVTVTSMEQPYKGVDDLVEAIALTRAAGTDLHLTVIGEGRLRPALERLAATRLGPAVTFTGHLATVDVRAALDADDVFVLPSWTEGLPRALVEAMAAGLPAVATRVGGVPELLEAHRVVPPRDPAALAAALTALVTDADAYALSSDRNLARARALAEDTHHQQPLFLRAVARAVRP